MLCAGLLLATVALALSAGIALAHPEVDHAIPPVGSTVATSPPEIRVFFTQTLNPEKSGVELATDNGVQVATEKAVVNGEQLSLRLSPLAPGKYLVKWHVVGIDGHQMTGDYPFEVGR